MSSAHCVPSASPSPAWAVLGGLHLLTLTRLGIGRFHLAEFDRYDLANFNRQVGATLSTLGLPKLEVMTGRARDVNPELELNVFAKGVDAANVDAFLDGVDVFVDGLDFFAFDTRELVFAGGSRGAFLRSPSAAGRRRGAFSTSSQVESASPITSGSPSAPAPSDRSGSCSVSPQRCCTGAISRTCHSSDLKTSRDAAMVAAMACHICAGIAATRVRQAAIATRISRGGAARGPFRRVIGTS